MGKNVKNIVLIFGAGITGLGAGYKLSENNYHVKVFEAEEYIGGQASSRRFRDCIFDFGPHTFHTAKIELLDFFTQLMNSEFLTLIKKVKIKFNDKLYDYPIKPLNLIRNLDTKLFLTCTASFFYKYFLKYRNSIGSLEELYISLYGKKLYNLFFENYTEKVWGYHPSELSNSFLRHRIPSKNLFELVFQSIRDLPIFKKSKLTKDNFIITQYYPKKGSIKFPEKMRQGISSHGGEVYTRSTLSKVLIEDYQIKEVIVSSGGKEKNYKSDFYVSTIPINELIESITPRPQEQVLKAAQNLRFRAIIIVCLIFAVDKVINTDTLYFHHQIFNRLGQMNSYSRETSVPGKSAITLEITCFPEDEYWSMEETNLIKKVLDGLKDEGFNIDDKLEGYFIWKNKYGYPIPTLNYEKNLFKIFHYLNSIKNLYVGGRQGLFTYIQMYQALEMGFKIAEDISHGIIKPTISVDIEDKYPLYI